MSDRASRSPSGYLALSCRGLVALCMAPVMGWVLWTGFLLPDVGVALRGSPVDGEVISARVVEVEVGSPRRSKQRHELRIEVAYSWEGTHHVSPSSSHTRGYPQRERAQRELAKYPIGRKVKLWIDPLAPERASLSRGLDPISVALMALIPALVWFANDELAKAAAGRRHAQRRVAGGAAIDPAPLESERWLGPRLKSTWLIVLILLLFAGVLARFHPLAPLAPACVATALLLVPPLRLLRALREDVRWRKTRLRWDAAAGAARLEGLSPSDAQSLTLRLQLCREEREPGVAAAWVAKAWVDQQGVSASIEGSDVRIHAPAEPWGSLEPLPLYRTWKGPGPITVDGQERRVRAALVAGVSSSEAAFAWPPGPLEVPEDELSGVSGVWRPLVWICGRPLTAAAVAFLGLAGAIALASLSLDPKDPGNWLVPSLLGFLGLQLGWAAWIEWHARRDTRDLIERLVEGAQALDRGEAIPWRGRQLSRETVLTRARSVYALPGLVVEAMSPWRVAPEPEGWTLSSAGHAWLTLWFGWGTPQRFRSAWAANRRGGQRVRVDALLDLLTQDGAEEALVDGRLPPR